MTALFDVQGFAMPSDKKGQYGTAAVSQSLHDLVGTGSNAISLVTLTFVTNKTSSDFHATSRTEDLANVGAMIDDAHAAGLKVLLKPHVDPLDGTERSQLTPSNVASFFEGYKALVLGYAKLAQEHGAETLSIGTELTSLTGAAYRPYWADLIAAVRQVYSGEVTYAAAWTEAAKVSFWDLVDTIGVNPYIPVADTKTPTLESISAAWNSTPFNAWTAEQLNNQSPIDFLKGLSLEYGKSIVFTELGYRSVDGAGQQPGNYSASGAVDNAEQKMLYEAFFTEFADQGSWFRGVYFWQFEAVYKSGNYDRAYTTQNKPANDLVTEWFHGLHNAEADTLVLGSRESNSLSGGVGDDRVEGGRGADTITGGVGDDLLIGDGREATARETTLVTVQAIGESAGGVAAKMQLIVNGKAFGAPVDVAPAKTLAEMGTYTFAIDATVDVRSLAVAFINNGHVGSADRNLYLKEIAVNGVALDPKTSMNTSVPGTYKLWSNGEIRFDLSSRPELSVGSASSSDVLSGGVGDDWLFGGAGDDRLDGGQGADAAVYTGLASDYVVRRHAGGTLEVRDKRGVDGTDTLANVERLQFSNGWIEIDDLSPEIMARSFDGSWTKKAITVTTPESGLTKFYDANWKLTGAEKVTTDGTAVTTQTYDASWGMTSAKVVSLAGKVETTKSYDANWKLLSATVVDSSQAEIVKKTYDGHWKLTAAETTNVVNNETVVKMYGGSWDLKSITVTTEKNGELTVKTLDKNWKMLSATTTNEKDGLVTTKSFDGQWKLLAVVTEESVAGEQVTKTYNGSWKLMTAEITSVTDGVSTTKTFDGAWKMLKATTLDLGLADMAGLKATSVTNAHAHNDADILAETYGSSAYTSMLAYHGVSGASYDLV